jgi:hypothetical protein
VGLGKKEKKKLNAPVAGAHSMKEAKADTTN